MVLSFFRNPLTAVEVVVSDHREILGKMEEVPDSRLLFSADFVGVLSLLKTAGGALVSEAY